MILSRWQLVLTLTPHLHPLPFSKGIGDAPALQHVLIAFCLRHTNYYVAPDGGVPSRRFPVLKLGRYPHSLAATSRLYLLFWKSLSSIPGFLIHSAFVRVSLYCTVTSVPTGISEKNFRAVSSGNRMQPCDAG